MSDIVTNAEVEDVLSSIRRLVGDNKRPVDIVESGSDSDRFVLTPQLRVSEQDVLLLQPEDAVAPAEDWYEFEEPPLPERLGVAVEGAQVYGEDIDDDENCALTPDPEQGDAGETAEHHGVFGPDDAMTSAADEAPGATSDGIDDKRQDFFALSAKIAALETAIAKTSDQWEPDDDGRDAYAGTRAPAMTWQADVELDAMGKPLHAETVDPPTAQEPQPTQTLEDVLDEQVIDEEMLRELVADIVRSELQGDLGERITRNVRKLVRREIHRALAAQSLD